MTNTETIKGLLQAMHGSIPGVTTAPVLRRKIETSELPCVILKTAEGMWGNSTTNTFGRDQSFIVECYVTPISTTDIATTEALIDTLIDRFAAAYNAGHSLAPGVWIREDFNSSGIIVLNWMAEYFGFIFDINITDIG